MRQNDAQSLGGGEVGRCGGVYKLLTANGRAAERILDSALLATASLSSSLLPVYPLLWLQPDFLPLLPHHFLLLCFSSSSSHPPSLSPSSFCPVP